MPMVAWTWLARLDRNHASPLRGSRAAIRISGPRRDPRVQSRGRTTCNRTVESASRGASVGFRNRGRGRQGPRKVGSPQPGWWEPNAVRCRRREAGGDNERERGALSTYDPDGATITFSAGVAAGGADN